MGFVAAARHRSKNVTLYKQGEVNFILNAEPGSFAQAFARLHGPSVCAIAFRVADAAKAYERAIALGAKPVHGKVGPMELNIPAIEGIGGSLIYLVDRYGDRTIYDVDFTPLVTDPSPAGVGLTAIDHLTHNVHRGRMELWAEFYERLFNFREIRYFDIEGKLTGLKSKAMTSPCGRIRIPINESADDKSQIAEYLEAYHGEGIQHIALATADIYATVEALQSRAVSFMSVPDTYYEAVDGRVPGHGEDLARLQRDRILIDGAPGARAGSPAADFHRDGDRPDLLRDHRAKGKRGFWRGQLSRPLRIDRTRPDPPRRPQTRCCVTKRWIERPGFEGADGATPIVLYARPQERSRDLARRRRSNRPGNSQAKGPRAEGHSGESSGGK